MDSLWTSKQKIPDFIPDVPSSGLQRQDLSTASDFLSRSVNYLLFKFHDSVLGKRPVFHIRPTSPNAVDHRRKANFFEVNADGNFLSSCHEILRSLTLKFAPNRKSFCCGHKTGMSTSMALKKSVKWASRKNFSNFFRTILKLILGAAVLHANLSGLHLPT